jgi:flagellar FliL protein
MAKEEQAAAEQPEEGGSKKKLFIIIGAAVGVAIILAVVFMMMGKGGKKEKPKDGAEATTEAKADAHGGAPAPAAGGAHGGGAPAAAGAAGVANIFPLEPFIVNIYDGQELRYLKVRIEMEMVGAGVKAELDMRLAAIRDSILVLLSTKTLQDIQDVQGKNQLKDEILAALNKLIPPGKISKIYFTDFVVQ